MYKVKDYITFDKEILGGSPVFKGTRVPVETLFLHLEDFDLKEHRKIYEAAARREFA